MAATGIIPKKLKQIIAANEWYKVKLNTAGPSVPIAKHGTIVFAPS